MPCLSVFWISVTVSVYLISAAGSSSEASPSIFALYMKLYFLDSTINVLVNIFIKFVDNIFMNIFCF